MIDVAIVGVGPAGANCAYMLAQNGVRATMFDKSHPREKPCGGMIGIAAKEAFSIIGKLPIPHTEIDSMRVISPRGMAWKIDLKNKLFGVSRLQFDQHLLNKALSKGASLIKENVVGLQKTGELWKIITNNQSYEARIIVGADGVQSVVRRNIILPLNRKNLGACFGYTFKGVRENSVTIKFSAKNAGYLWVIPKGDHTSIGGGTTKIELFRNLKDEVNSFVKTCYPQLERNSIWASLIPNVKDARTLFSQVSGSNWVLIGDAAGHVSPISGSGIEYALTDGELAAQAITEGHVEQFSAAWIKNYGKNLANEARLAKLIYRGPMLELYCMFAKLRTSLTFS